MTFLTPLGALAALAALLPLAAWASGHRRAEAVGRSLGLPPPTRRRAMRALVVTAAIVLLGLAAAQPALTRRGNVRERSGIEALFVFDTSRSMAASATPSSPTRLDRAVAAAVRLRGEISDVPAGIATLTDRVLPDLGPVADVGSFESTAERAVAIESPPPADTAVRATTFGALGDIASGNYFSAKAARRLVILLTDGESNPVDAGELARALPAARGYRFLAIRFWNGGEAVYNASGKRESAYRPDPFGRVVLDDVARVLGGRAFEERQLAGARAQLRRSAGNGPTAGVAAATQSRTLLAPYLATVALVLLLLALVSMPRVMRPIGSKAT